MTPSPSTVAPRARAEPRSTPAAAAGACPAPRPPRPGTRPRAETPAPITAPAATVTSAARLGPGIDERALSDHGPPPGAAKPRASPAAPRGPARPGARWPHPSVAPRRPDAVHEVLALDPQRLDVGDPRGEDVPAAGDVLAVGAGVLVKALVVDGQLALELHVVEGGHPARADDREAALLVRVEPAQMQVGRQSGGEAQEAEDDVLDPRADVGLAVGHHLIGLLAGQVEHHRDVVRAEAPERVLVGAQLAQVQAVAVDVVDLAQLAGVGQLLELLHARVVLEQVPDHQHAAGLARRRPPPARRRPPTGPAASRRSSACPPPARRRPARRGWARAWPAPPRRARGRPAGPSSSPVDPRGRGAAAARRPRGRRGVAAPGDLDSRGWRRSCGPGWVPSSRGRRRRRGAADALMAEQSKCAPTTRSPARPSP